MNASWFKKALPHLIAVVVFLLVSIIYNRPALQGKVLYQSDVIGYKGMAQQSVEYKAKYGHFPLWTESMFSGMPAYNIALEGTSRVTIGYAFYLFNLGLPKPIYFFFTACVCFYLLTQVLSLNKLIGVFASIAFAYASFDSILVASGHDSEIMALSYLPAVIAGVLLILQKKYLSGAALTALLFGIQVSTQHLQIIYYTGIITAFIIVAYLVHTYKNTSVKDQVIALAVVAGSLLLGFMNYALVMFPTKEYATETMRGGKSELSQADSKNKTKGGLNKDYAFMWSYGIRETLTLFVPGMSGGGSSAKALTSNSKMGDKLMELGIPEDNALGIANSTMYWGEQPFTGGPVYLGAVLCFLFILGIVYVKSWHKWWILAVTLLGILLAWGSNFSGFNYFLFDHLPLYNKFRAPTMALIIPQFTFPLLAAMGLQEIIRPNAAAAEQWKKYKTALIATGALILVTLIAYLGSDFKSDKGDANFRQNFSGKISQSMSQGKPPTPEIQQQVSVVMKGIMNGLVEDRKSVFLSDFIRSVVLVLITALFGWLLLSKRIKADYFLVAVLLLSSYDLIAEGKKYLNDETYVDPENIEAAFSLSTADQMINADPDKNFRVLDESGGDPFQNSHASYYHNSVGGYHPAKLALYNDIIERQLSKGNQMVFNMLNTRYIIQRPPGAQEDQAVRNPGAFGACWLVQSIKYVKNADDEMTALDSTNTRDTAIVQQNFKSAIPFEPVKDTTASLRLLENLNDQLTYAFNAATNQFAVFSEVYYDKGWNAFIDGKPAPYVKVDYILRGMAVPAGKHTIEFRFEPKSFATGNTISILAAIGTYLLIIAAFVACWRNRKITVA